jgi:hypothetical protein
MNDTAKTSNEMAPDAVFPEDHSADDMSVPRCGARSLKDRVHSMTHGRPGRRPNGQWYLRSFSAIGRSLMPANLAAIRSPANAVARI